MGVPNWSRLVSTDRIKAVGMPWSDKELQAIRDGVEPDFVRRGALTLEAVEKMVAGDSDFLEENGRLPVNSMNRSHLATRATELGIAFSPETPEDTLRASIIQIEESDEAGESEDESDQSEDQGDPEAGGEGEESEEESKEEKPKTTRKTSGSKKK